ncbi:MAG TPA: cobalt-precorrin-6A reductase [Streptosporangiaceae bacterium]|nr:cobalt-precorrin-6A reductase [Streptosporangiaceae bacterium]
MRVLLLGGTGEARQLAAGLAARPGVEVISSLAGRTAAPAWPAGRTRVGGFGGPGELAAWLEAERIDAVVDATHPFAAAMTAAAVAATAQRGVPLVVLRRPGWTAGPGDDWRRVPSLAAAAASLPGQRVLLTVGRTGLDAFAADRQRWYLIRSVQAPEPPLPRRAQLIQARGPFAVADELALMRGHAIDVVVTKDSGGDLTSAKLAAARELGLPVVMVDRPAVPDAVSVATVAAALAWLEHR